MKLLAVIIVGMVLALVACTKTDQGSVTPAAPEHTAGGSRSSHLNPADLAAVGNDPFVRHMHFHASQLEWLNDALEAGDLDAARMPAYWLAAHQTVSDIPEEWVPHIRDMRTAAGEVNDAVDIEAARAAAQRIEEGCRACHVAAGADVTSLTLE